jgi:hypothetical protein
MGSRSKRCFIISPIGDEGSEWREHADLVKEFIIDPAMEELGIYAYRSDQNLTAGRITEQMFESLLSDDLCIAILTYHNPNVFYELAIAQSSGRPTVILIEKGGVVPFDLHDIRRIEYDFNPRAIRDKAYVRQLAEQVRSIERNGWRAEVPFGKGLSPLASTRQAVQIYNNLADFGGDEPWHDLINDATNDFCLAGIVLQQWTTRRMRVSMADKAQAGCQIRMMVMDPQNPAFAAMISQNDAINQSERIATQIRLVEDVMRELSAANDSIQFKLIERGMLHQQLVLSDSTPAARLLCYSVSNSDAPIIYVRRPSHLADLLQAEFETLWKLN